MTASKILLFLLVQLLIMGTSAKTCIGGSPPDSVKQDFLIQKAQLDSAITHGSKQEIEESRKKFAELAENEQYKVQSLYYMAYAEYRLSSLFSEMNDNEKENLLDSSIKKLKNVVELNPGYAEGWALLGNCYGMKATGMISGMRYGPKSERAIEKALNLAPENPRINLIYGISLFYKPGIFGGSNEKAMNTFRQTADLFKEYKNEDQLSPGWGEAENYAWLAQTYLKKEDFQQARAAYKKALSIEPDYYWIKEILLPELEKIPKKE